MPDRIHWQTEVQEKWIISLRCNTQQGRQTSGNKKRLELAMWLPHELQKPPVLKNFNHYLTLTPPQKKELIKRGEMWCQHTSMLLSYMSIQHEDQAQFQSIKILIDIPEFQKTSLMLPFEFYPLIDGPEQEPSFLVQVP